MAVIKLVEDYAVTQLRKDVRDSLTLAGEQAILLNLFHPADPDAIPCPQCGDDVYMSAEVNCTSCYGTRYEGAVRSAMKVWTLFTDQDVSETVTPRGIADPDTRSVQFEAFPRLKEHDIIVRVRTWTGNTPNELEGYYILQTVKCRSLRTGSRFGQANWDVVGQKAQISQMDASEAITRYPILGKTFEPSMGQTIGPSPVTAPASLPPAGAPPTSPFVVLTQAEYDALPQPIHGTVYVIEG